MARKVRALPRDYPVLTPYLICKDASRATGAKGRQPVENKFYGDRSGTIEDPFGHVWSLSTHVEDVSPEEMEKRAAALFSQ